MTVRQLDIPTEVGTARATMHPAPRRRAGRGALVLGHGAGGGVDARDLVALAGSAPAHGIDVVLVEQPWRVSGRRVAGAPQQLDRAWTAALAALEAAGDLARPLVVGGRSAGARVACRTAGAVGADACLALAFPLHPPGRPERSRVEELLGCPVPVLVVQGERDSFGGPAEFPAGTRVVPVPLADHGFRVPARVDSAATMGLVVTAVLDWWELLKVAAPARRP